LAILKPKLVFHFDHDLKGGQCHEILTTGYFHESVSLKPLSIPLGPFKIFLKICGDIRSSKFATGVVDSSGKCKKSSIIKVLII
jgi:hypothetical protein